MIHWLWLIPTAIVFFVFGAWSCFAAVRAIIRQAEKDVKRRREMTLGELVSRINKQHTAN